MHVVVGARGIPRQVFLFAALSLLCAGFLGAGRAQAQDDPIVYVRCARTDQNLVVSRQITVNGVAQMASKELLGLDGRDALPETARFFGSFSAPCDLVLRQPGGNEQVLYDCSSTSTEDETCAAMDPAVSFDGRTIAFSVFRGPVTHPHFDLNSTMFNPNANPESLEREILPNKWIGATEAQLHLVDVASGQTTPLPHDTGVFDTGPAFLPDGRMTFTSTRDGNRATLIFRTTLHRVGTRLWTMDVDGSNPDLASHHSLAMQQHPFVLRDGRVAYSSWEIGMGRPFRHANSGPVGFDTPNNLFHLFTQSPDGANNFALYGQHSGDHRLSTFGAVHDAAHFMTQTGDGWVWSADYYRGNNNGLGSIIGFVPEPEGQEGMDAVTAPQYGDMYVPRQAKNLAPWGRNEDVSARAMEAPLFEHPNYPGTDLPYTGKIGHPSALRNEKSLMLTWGKGPCFSAGGAAIRKVTELGIDTPGCDAGLYRTTALDENGRVHSEHPSDLEVIVDTREWHEFMGRAVVPYNAIHGVEKPPVIERADLQASRPELETGTPFGLLGAASILDRETHPRDGLHFAGLKQFHQQGTDTINYDDDELCGIRILGVMPNRGSRNDVYNSMRFNPAGERIGILGEFPVRNKDGNGQPILDKNGDPDTSFLARMPANVPYFMQAIDCEGRTLNTDQTWQSLRPGEVKTCGGCHVHSRESKLDFQDSFAALDTYRVHRLGEGTVPLLAGTQGGNVQTREVPGDGLFIDFEEDIMPMFAQRCVDGCHGGTAPSAGLALDRLGAGDDIEHNPRSRDPDNYAIGNLSTKYCLVMDAFQQCVPEDKRIVPYPQPAGMMRPQLSRYIRAYNSRASLLYWKARGERTDNNTDDSYTEASLPEDRDIDYGAAHPDTGITEEELGMLARWIDLGSAGANAKVDTQKPTLHLSAILSGQSVTELRIGTNDLGDGVDPATLEVCVLGPNDACSDLSGDADPHGVVTVALGSPLTDPTQEVRAKVRDRAGNETVVRRNVAWLLNSTPPPPPWIDAGGGPGVGPSAQGNGGKLTGGCHLTTTAQTGGATWLIALCGLLGWRRRRR